MTVVQIRDVSAPPLELHTQTYLAAKRKRLTVKSERGYSAVLREFVEAFPDRDLSAFEPPEAAPLTTLRESKFVPRGKLYVIHPGLLGDLNGR